MNLLKDMCSLYKITMNYIMLGKSTKKTHKNYKQRERRNSDPPFLKQKGCPHYGHPYARWNSENEF